MFFIILIIYFTVQQVYPIICLSIAFLIFFFLSYLKNLVTKIYIKSDRNLGKYVLRSVILLLIQLLYYVGNHSFWISICFLCNTCISYICISSWTICFLCNTCISYICIFSWTIFIIMSLDFLWSEYNISVLHVFQYNFRNIYMCVSYDNDYVCLVLLFSFKRTNR